MSDQTEHDEPEIIELENEDGESFQFVFLGVMEMEGAQFAILAPAADFQDPDNDNLELYTFRYSEDEAGAGVFDVIEDDALAERVFKMAVEHLSDDDDN